jgi:hypothetical protein
LKGLVFQKDNELIALRMSNKNALTQVLLFEIFCKKLIFFSSYSDGRTNGA